MTKQDRYLTMLVPLLALFCLRVAGQALVAFFHVSFLPPMSDWFSGILPYPWLLSCQLGIIWLYGAVCVDFVRGEGYFVTPHPRLGNFLLKFGSVYLGVMIVRYVIRMTLYPAERWTGGSIPIFFHWVLAAFLLVLGTYHAKSNHGLAAHTSWFAGGLNSVSRLSLGLTLSLAVLLWIGWQVFPTAVAWHLGMRGPQYAVRLQSQVPMVTSDGVTLKADIFSPEHVERTPTVLVRIPFSRSIKTAFFEDLIGRIFAERGYTVVIQGSRGRLDSGGAYYPLRGERRDGIETLQWISKRPWFNGKLVTWGGSAFGYTQWAISDQTNPGPSAMYIYEASSDFHRMFYPGGAFSLYSALSWAITSYGRTDRVEWPLQNEVNNGADGFPLIDADRRATDAEIQFFRDWVRHYERDQYWIDIDGIRRESRIKAPLFLMAGWCDPFLPTQLENFMEIRRTAPKRVAERCRLVIGPWNHAGEIGGVAGSEKFRPKSVALALSWFDEILRDAHGDTPPVEIFVMGKNRWRRESEWPLKRAQYTPLYLGSAESEAVAGGNDQTVSGSLSSSPAPEDQVDSFMYDPRNPVPTCGGAMIGHGAGIYRQNQIESRSDVLLYTSRTLEKDVEVTGPVTAIIYVSSSSICTDFTAKLVDVYPDQTASAFNVCDGIIRHRFSQSIRSPIRRTIEKVTIQLWPTSMVFLKGHRIRLEISSSNFPRFDRNPNTGNQIATETRPIVAKQSVHIGPDHHSCLILPVIP